jgi:hypothetical protein
MRFFPAERPAARKILAKLSAIAGHNVGTTMILTAVSGTGKTSAIFQVARDVFTLYIPYTPAAAVHDQPKRLARDKTGSFADLEAAIKCTVPCKTSAWDRREEGRRLSLIFLIAH